MYLFASSARHIAYYQPKMIVSIVFSLLPILGKVAVCDPFVTDKLVAPIVINTWNFTSANSKAWSTLESGGSALDAIEHGCSQCEQDRCDGTVGWGGSPAETGETTLDAMIMDGTTYNVGAVGGLRRIRNAISVARAVLETTNHTMLVGEMATAFAVQLGFKEQSLTSKESREIQKQWLADSCQPNYWKNVEPNPRISCGPYHKATNNSSRVLGENTLVDITDVNYLKPSSQYGQRFLLGHDTVGMIAMDSRNRLASGASTNGLRHKILGRVGDSPIAGSGSYAAKDAGAAAATGDGDVIMRFLLSFKAVENLRSGMSAHDAAWNSVASMISRTGKPYPQAALIVLSLDGTFGAACCGFERFPFVVSDSTQHVRTYVVQCSV